MKKLIILTAAICFAGVLPSQNTQKSSSKTKGLFRTTVSLDIKSSNEKALTVIDKFIDQYNHNIPPLFGWALTGIKLQGEKDSFIEFNIKSHDYNKTNNTVNGVMAINVGMLGKHFENINYKTQLRKEVKPDNSVILRYEMLECEEVISKVVAELNVVQKTADTVQLTFAVDVKLSMPYNLMTFKQYRENLEWRFVKFLQNIRKELEK
ncbi:MAG: hypothetical protein LBH80_04915 [Prevotellaceae bacterium]|jgi:hypothetical protein|nr:hypothetical protein [Prevotellaceae bacterium]